MNKPKVLVLTSSYPKYKGDINGNFVYELATRLKSEFDIIVLTPAYSGSVNPEIIDDIKIYRHKQFFIRNVELAYGSDIMAKIKKNFLYLFVVPFYLTFQFYTLSRIAKKERIQLIHAHWLLPQGFIAVLYKRLLNRKIKIVVTAHGADINSFNNLFGNRLKKYTLNRIDQLTVVSNAFKEKVKGLGYKKDIYVYPMGIDTVLFSPEKKDESIKEKYNIYGHFLLFVGGLIERKGIRYLIHAMPAVIKKFPTVKLLAIGEGNLKNEMLELTKKLNISDNIIFTGSIPHDDLPNFFATADLFVLPSFSEGWPVAVMEAFGSGTRAIVTEIPVFEKHELKEQLFSLVPVANSLSLSEVIIKELSSKSTQRSKSKYLRNYALNNFDWGYISNNYKNIFIDLID